MTDFGVGEYVAIGSVIVNLAVAFIGLKLSNEIGKSESRMAEKIRQVEIYMRDNYVLKEDYRDMVKAMNTSIDAQFNRIYTELARIFERIDRVNGQS